MVSKLSVRLKVISGVVSVVLVPVAGAVMVDVGNVSSTVKFIVDEFVVLVAEFVSFVHELTK